MDHSAKGGIFDYIIVGSGSAGSALAARLADDGRDSVLILEAGPRDNNRWFHLPIGYYKTVGNPKFDWNYRSEPEQELGGRRINVPRARVVGGCGAINGLGYIRGQHADYDRWQRLGNSGWSWKDVEPYFKRLEGLRQESEVFGQEGPIGLRKLVERREICESFMTAASSFGVPIRDYFSGGAEEGAAYLMTTVEKGWRTSTAANYLKPRLKRPNLNLEVEALCEAIIFEDQTATSVRYRQGEKSYVARARRDIILCAGTINTPQLLQVSGVGPSSLLTSLGIEVIRDLEGVGENLQEHFNVETEYRLNKPISLNDDLRRPLWKMGAALKWMLTRDGPLTASAAHITAFVRSMQHIERPDLQLHFIPLSLDENRVPRRYSGASLDVYQMRPESRGTVAIRSRDPREKPSITFRFLSSESDRKVLVAGLKIVRRITQSPHFRKHVTVEEQPGLNVETDDEFLSFARESGFTDYHPVGTCKMGVESDAVVDHCLRVIGTRNLRIADCSVIPEIVSGNTHACAIMIAEKAADMIREDAKQLH